MSEMARLYAKHKHTPARLARKYAGESAGRRYDELYEVAMDAFYETIGTGWVNYDPARARESTWIYRRVSWAILSHLRSNQRKHADTLDVAAAVYTQAKHSERVALQQTLRELSDEAQSLVRLILFAPGELATDLLRPRKIKTQQILYTMLASRGWALASIDRACLEVQGALAS